jgi:hypothetical protein
MKKLLQLSFILLIPCLFSCKKTIEKKQRDYLVDVLASGNWKIEYYAEGQNDLSYLFADYLVTFKSDETMEISNGFTTVSGTWVGDIATYSFNASFINAPSPVDKLNGKWIVTNGHSNYVEASMNTSGGVVYLHIRKA